MAGDALAVEQFALVEREAPALALGEALVRVRLINVHAATRQRMASGMTPLGETDRTNYACAEVVESRSAAFREGDLVACQAGWQELQVIRADASAVGYGAANESVRSLNGTASQWCYAFRPHLARAWPESTLMGVFGTSGLTAWFGMRACRLQPGSLVAMAAATGSVGSLAGQIARAAGCKVVGIAGGRERCDWVRQALGLTDCLDYRHPALGEHLSGAFPHGIDVFSDGVGGRLTQIVVPLVRDGGHVFSYGSAAKFHSKSLAEALLPRVSLRHSFGITQAIASDLEARNIALHAWIVDQFYDERLAAEDALDGFLRSGQLKPVNHVVEGFEKLPEAIVSLYAGKHVGKLQCRF